MAALAKRLLFVPYTRRFSATSEGGNSIDSFHQRAVPQPKLPKMSVRQPISIAQFASILNCGRYQMVIWAVSADGIGAGGISGKRERLAAAAAEVHLSPRTTPTRFTHPFIA